MLKSPAETGFSYCALSFHWLLLLWFEVLSLVPTHASMFSWDLTLLSFRMDVCISGNIIYFKNLSHLIIYIATLPWLSWTMVFSPWTVRDFFLNACVCAGIHVCTGMCVCVRGGWTTTIGIIFKIAIYLLWSSVFHFPELTSEARWADWHVSGNLLSVSHSSEITNAHCYTWHFWLGFGVKLRFPRLENKHFTESFFRPAFSL